MCTIMNMVHPHIQISPESIKIYQKFTLCNIQIIPMIVEICKICTLWGGIWPEGRRGFYSCPSQSLLLSPSSAHYAYSWLSPPPCYILCKFGSLRGNFLFSCCWDFVSHCPPPWAKFCICPSMIYPPCIVFCHVCVPGILYIHLWHDWKNFFPPNSNFTFF